MTKQKRCTAKTGTTRCEKYVGHAGEHVAYRYHKEIRWASRITEAENRALWGDR